MTSIRHANECTADQELPGSISIGGGRCFVFTH